MWIPPLRQRNRGAFARNSSSARLTRRALPQNNRPMRRDDLIQQLANSENPSIRWKVRVGVLDEDPNEWITADALSVLHAAGWL